MTATASPCVATVSAPAAPPASIHQGIVRARMPARSAAVPLRPTGRDRRQHDEDDQARAERDRRGEQAVVEARPELPVDACLHGRQDADEGGAAERDPGGKVRAGHRSILPVVGTVIRAGARPRVDVPGVWPSPPVRAN